MTDFSAPKYNRENSETDIRFRRVLFLSIGLHILVLIVIPLMTRLFWKEKEFKRPQTFQLVQAPQPVPPARKAPPPPEPARPEPQPETPPPPTPPPPPEPRPTPAPQPKPEPPKKKAPTPDPAPPQPRAQERPAEPVEQPPPPPPPQEVVRPVEDNVDDLEAALFGSAPVPVQMSAPGDFKFHWYLNNVRAKIEQNWRPPTEDRKLEVVVRFYINSDGSAAGINVSKSSGNSTLDNLAIRAVTVSSPFGKLPPGFSGDRLDINLTLRPTRR